MYKEEQDLLEEEMRKIDECETKEFDRLLIDSSEKTIAILGDRCGHRQRYRKEMILVKRFNAICGKNVMRAQMLEVSQTGVGTRKGCVANG